MKQRFKFTFTSTICLLLTSFEVCTVGAVFFNPCTDLILNCQCGVSSGYPIRVTAKQCFNFYTWPPRCILCESAQNPMAFLKGQNKDSTTVDILCEPFRQCQDCQDGLMQCVSCPRGKYGLWCHEECQCQNEGVCNQQDGTCACPSGYVGEFCQTLQASKCQSLVTVAHLQWINGQSNDVGTVATAQCDLGYALIGDKTRTCTPKGKWTGKPPMCDPVCPFPRLSPHLQTKVNPGMSAMLLDADNREVVKEIIFSCNAGYTLVGPHRIQCQITGSWDQKPPRCKPKILCSEPGTPSHCTRLVLDEVDGAFAPGSQIRYTCEDGFYLEGANVLICITTGRWSAATPKCLPVTGCPVPVVPRNAHVEVTEPITSAIMPTRNTVVSRMRMPPGVKLRLRRATEHPPGHASANSRALYTCKSVFYRLQGPSSRMCLPSGEWGGQEPACAAICGRAFEPKRPSIINGTISELGKWPWQAAVGFRNNGTGKWRKICGGALISDSLVVTAAHCVTQKSSARIQPLKDFKVYLGKVFRFDDLDDPEVRVIMVESITVHPNFHPRSLDSDIAIIQLKIPVEFTRRIQPVCLPQPTMDWREDLPEGQMGVVTGWGHTEDGFPSDMLQEAAIPIVARHKCEEGYRSANVSVTVTTNMFCAGFEQGGTGTCKGDSGGPFVTKTGTSNTSGYVLDGLISWGSTNVCAMAGQYSGFLKVANFVGWINHFL